MFYQSKYILFVIVFFSCLKVNVQAQSMCIGDNGAVDWLIYDDVFSGDLDYLYHQYSFPDSPDDVKSLTQLGTITNYKNNYGSLIRGFIQAPETGTYTFNLTGDDESHFYLSTDDTPANLALICRVPDYTGVIQHTVFPEQTSVNINLVAGNYYYFEVLHSEGGGGDHVHAYWRLPSNPTADWTIIHGTHLYKMVYDTGCAMMCPSQGTPCDDGDPNTTDDQEDGHCNCTGTPISGPSCLGERGSIQVLYYDNIPGYGVNELYNAPHYPDAPDRGEYLDDFQKYPDWNTSEGGFGTRIQCFLKAPETGDYLFSISGASQTSLKLSTDTAPANKVEICNTWYSPFLNHWYTTGQTSAPIPLQAGNYYYLEFNHKNHSGSPFFNISWKTPLQQDTSYHYINPTYVYGYACETACLPQGLPCDDGDATTFDDQYDDNCTCTGTPCADPECTNSYNYTPIETCAAKDEHSTYENDSWLSCQTSPSPNPARGDSHWIEYDLGQTYIIEDAQVWNYNVSGATQQGFQNVIIDYTSDGVNWTELGQFTWTQAPGLSTYQGFTMAAFAGIVAQKVLITAVDNFDDSSCMGISEVRFTASSCPAIGTPCDDGFSNTINDQYDAYCNCAGQALVVNDCTDPILFVNDNPIISDNYDAINQVFSTGLVPNGAFVSFVAGESITLDPGFEVELGGDFLADIISCSPLDENQPTAKNTSTDWLLVANDAADATVKVTYHLQSDSACELALYTLSGKKVLTLEKGEIAKGTYATTIQQQALDSGIYMVVLKTKESQLSERLVVVSD